MPVFTSRFEELYSHICFHHDWCSEPFNRPEVVYLFKNRPNFISVVVSEVCVCMPFLWEIIHIDWKINHILQSE